ncbi:peptidoglycan/xylan/chitin deacetylase (PgdA/CDA1 family) [Algoriphagus boseongensis]|uniref:Peptidoglycan/xylan/chitin deacetylase (PgdA/CDA1 family) n=1 Tax=Algoriphagus boseongensis TaxID=1442587 RepID=A0A4R6T3X6_9BACT|nr:polysaccharide deacetylase family protein [Algoriphagus boseongensis]TDQ15025.1 peptidoglycan/xylan/chitin deacetylase (PgdA/CDA1 family) [Algoriphagus boseongensis]
MVFHSVPKPIQLIFPKRKWEGDGKDDQVYLTFDDGPVPGVTDFVLEELSKRDQKATFFMVGDNVRKHSSLAKEVLSEGHGIGNHTYSHLNGYKTSYETYYKDFLVGENIFQDNLGIKTSLFRPPYGLLKHSQAEQVRETHQIIMWSVLSGDYSTALDSSQVLVETQKRTKAGSIVVFHDQEKTTQVLPEILPSFLDFLIDRGLKTALL